MLGWEGAHEASRGPESDRTVPWLKHRLWNQQTGVLVLAPTLSK